MIRRTLVVLTVALVWSAIVPVLAGAQLAGNTENYKIRVRRINGAHIKIDGKLDEPIWATIDPITNFTQTQPKEGAPVSRHTEARIFYDDNNIYFGFRFEDDPDKINYHFVARDVSSGSDSADILLDTFHDRRTGYFFSITAAGVQFDGTFDESRGGQGFGTIDLTWDGIWYSAVSRESWGWSAEVMIPFKSIRISQASSQEWGINLGRERLRDNEFAFWVPVPRFEGFMKPSRAGVLTGLEDIHVGRNLELVPFAAGAERSDGRQPQLNKFTFNGGLNARYGLRQNLTANLTINPDFGETEADQFTSEVSRFEIFFPEKRQFFTEGANYFQTPLQLFFSRRIGAPMPDGEPQRILEGGKITGKSGAWTIGALEALTQTQDYVDPAAQTLQQAPGAFYGVLRMQHDLFQKSAFGFMTVNRRQQPGSVGQSESTHAVDLSILSGPHIRWVSQAMVNTNDAHPGVDAQHLGWTSEFIYDSDRFTYDAGGKFLGNKVDLSHTGFEPEVDRWIGWTSTTWKPFINRYGVRQLFFNLNYDQANGTHGELEDSNAYFDFTAQFKNFWQARFRGNYDRTRFFFFTPDFQRLPNTRGYEQPTYIVELSSNQSRRVYFDLLFQTQKMVQYNENFYGSLKGLQLQSTARLGRHLRWELNAIHIDEHLLDGRHFQYRRFFISRLTYQFTTKARARVFAQYAKDRHGNDLSINSLFAYDFTARSALYVGYNRQRRSPFAVTDLGNQVFVKLSYLFAF
ncbi:MAG: carbohydrate binding family 9 domain-containing protein [Acidobacteriia bacterium]|nr:carbohydrate binding family 9 domain-containing protein [Terriglobia bacterium]